MSEGYLTNLRIISDLYLEQFEADKAKDTYGILNADFLRYVKYLAIEQGLSGFRIQKKVGEFIQGYKDEMLE